MSVVTSEMQSNAEDDEMWRGFEIEIRSWVKDMKSDKATIEMWIEFKKTGK